MTEIRNLGTFLDKEKTENEQKKPSKIKEEMRKRMLCEAIIDAIGNGPLLLVFSVN